MENTLDLFAETFILETAKNIENEEMRVRKQKIIEIIKHKVSHFSHIKKEFKQAQDDLKSAIISYRVCVWSENGDELMKLEELPEQSVMEVLVDMYKGQI